MVDESLHEDMSTVAIVGLGYVGLPLAMLYVNKGLYVIGIDIDEKKIDSLKQGKSYLADYKDQDIKTLTDSKYFQPTNQFSKLKEVDACIICVPTPLREHRYPDLSFLTSAAKEISPYLKHGQLVVLESSTYPGTTEEVLLPELEKNGRKV